MRFINTFQENDNVSGIYLCKFKQLAKTKMGKSYYNMKLQDKTGIIDAKIWDLSNAIEDFDQMDYIDIHGNVTSFQGALQLNIVRVRRAREGEYYPSDYLPTSEYNIDEMFKSLLGYIDSIKNPALKALCEHFFVKDKNFIKEFKTHTAAKSVHHGFVGGLLEHTLSVAVLCDFYAKRYTLLNRDLLMAAAICHDIGKIYELSPLPENDYTDEGQLLGHIVMGIEMIHDAIKEIPKFPKQLENEIKHCIAAHHGELEFGSPKKPALVEAMALNMADNLDAKMESFKEIFAEAGDETGWLGFNRIIDSNIRKTGK